MPTTNTRTVIPGGGGDYTSLSAWEAGRQANLVSGDLIEQAECYSGLDSTNFTIDGWTTSATQYIRIFTPAAERHDGKWNTSKYRLYVENATPINQAEDYVRIEGLQIGNHTPTGVSRHAAMTMVTALGAGANETRLTHCVIRGHGNGTHHQKGVNMDASNAVLRIANCVFFNFATISSVVPVIGVTGSTISAYNVTAIGGQYCFQRDSITTFTAKNCYGGGSSSSDYQGTIGKTNCASEDTSSDGTAPQDSIPLSTDTFVSVTGGSEDFHLVTGSGLIDVGADLSADATFPFSDDIDGVARSGTWDIGADEYVAVGGGSQVKTVSGLAIASVKTVQGLAIASTKTILGVTNV